MKRTCARSTCPGSAVATLSYSYAERIVWVEALADEPHPMVHDLCERHASSVNVPRGWELRDQRHDGRAAEEVDPYFAAVARHARFDLIGA